MRIEEAIQELKTLEYYDRPFDNSETEDKKGEALYMAIKALEYEQIKSHNKYINIIALLDKKKEEE